MSTYRSSHNNDQDWADGVNQLFGADAANDIGQLIDEKVERDGTIPMTGDLNMGGNSLTNVGGVTGTYLYGNYLTPEDFGAVGDGITDDTAAVQACLDAAGQDRAVLLGSGGSTYYITDQLDVPIGGCRIMGNISNSYSVSSGRSRYHILCGIGAAPTKKLFSLALADLSSGTAILEDVNIDMDDSTATFLEAEAGGPQAYVKNATIDNCGLHGIVLNSGSNTSRIENVNISGISTASTTDGTGIAAGSIGINVAASDVKVLNSEVKGKFAVGLQVLGNHCTIMGNYIDQNTVNYIDYAVATKCIGNRFQYAYTTGVEIGSAGTPCKDISFVGNEVAHNNTDKTLTTGTYDGVGMELVWANGGTISGNNFTQQLTGIVATKTDDIHIGANRYRDLDGDFLDYSGNTGGITVLDGSIHYRVNGTATGGSLNHANTFSEFTKPVKAGAPIQIGQLYPIAMASNEAVSTLAYNIIHMTGSTGGLTLTLDDTNNAITRDAIVTILNKTTTTVTLANTDGSIYGTTSMLTDVSYTYVIVANGDLIQIGTAAIA